MKKKHQKKTILKKVRFYKKKQRKAKKKGRFFKMFFLIIILSVCLVLLALSPLFRIRSIEIRGANHTNHVYLATSLPLDLGDHWYYQTGLRAKDWFFKSHSEAESHLVENLPYIKKAQVDFFPIGRLVVRVEEREPTFLLMNQDRYFILSEDGFVLELVDPILRPNLPVLENLSFETPSLGQKIEFKEPFVMDHAKLFLQISNRLDDGSNEYLLHKVTALDFSKIDNFSFVLDNRIRVVLKEVEKLDKYRAKLINEIFTNQLDVEASGSLDFSGDSSVGIFTPD